ncbi:MAG: hypothetical protein KGL39_28805 [Patescibacteria group bacterium]|nr:hypothetical protein [Patescibacteria group bacterium]
MKQKSQRKWRRADRLHEHLEATVAALISRGRLASRQAGTYLQMYRENGPSHWSHEQFLRYRSKRCDFIHAARLILDAAFEGGYPDNSNERRLAKLREERNALPAVEEAA